MVKLDSVLVLAATVGNVVNAYSIYRTSSIQRLVSTPRVVSTLSSSTCLKMSGNTAPAASPFIPDEEKKKSSSLKKPKDATVENNSLRNFCNPLVNPN